MKNMFIQSNGLSLSTVGEGIKDYGSSHALYLTYGCTCMAPSDGLHDEYRRIKFSKRTSNFINNMNRCFKDGSMERAPFHYAKFCTENDSFRNRSMNDASMFSKRWY